MKEIIKELLESGKNRKKDFSCEYGGEVSIGCGCGGCTAYYSYLDCMEAQK